MLIVVANEYKTCSKHTVRMTRHPPTHMFFDRAVWWTMIGHQRNDGYGCTILSDSKV